MTVLSETAEATIRKAKLCYSLGLISEQHMERSIEQAEQEPEYDGIDLPFEWDIQRELDLRKQAEKAARPSLWRRITRKAVGP